jgi:predicted DNA binding CopG/RHH family protein
VIVPPNQPATPNRTIRVPDELWEAAKRKASDRGETVTDVILRALRRYLRDY